MGITSPMTWLFVLICIFSLSQGPIKFAADASIFYDTDDMNIWTKQRQLDSTMRLLFPNQTALNRGIPLEHDIPDIILDESGNLRKGGRDLSLKTIGLRPPYERLAECVKTSDCERPECKCVRCVKCTAAQVPTCNILRDRIVQETYYPDLSSTYTAKCEIIDQLANRLSGEIFGNGRTFRDTAQCRDIVMQYLCLFYGSNNPMYTNYCVYQEEDTDPLPANKRFAPRPPCRGFCTQVMEVCANEPDLIDRCQQIACPPGADDLPVDNPFYDPDRIQDCTPDPELGGQKLNQLLSCERRWEQNPYFKAAGNTFLPNMITTSINIFIASMMMLLL